MQAIQHDKIELYLCCRNLKNMDLLSKSDPQVRLYVKDNEKWNLMDQTEVIQDNLNPVFDTTFILNYSPEVERHLKFEVIDIDSETTFDIIGYAETTVSEILGTRKHLLTIDLAHQGKTTGELVIRAEKVNKTCHMVAMKLSGVDLINKDLFGKSDPFLRFYKIRHGGDQVLVHETEVINDNLCPQWELIKIKDYKLSGNDYNSHFKIECWDYESDGGHKYIGGYDTSLNELKEGKNSFDLISFKDNKKTGQIKVDHFCLEERKSFENYINSDEQLNTIVAIDFSKANNSSRNTTSLHSQAIFNDYQLALKCVSEIILTGKNEKQVPVFGFGAKLSFPFLKTSEVSHHFACTGDNENPNAAGVSGIMQAYSNAVQHVKLAGPTHFAPIITEAIKISYDHKERDTGVYSILLIFTAGVIDDMEATVKALSQAAYLPLSIIIIGLGDGDFTKMKSLDDNMLTNKKGQKPVRDLVQFVAFKGFSGDMDYLSERVFAEIPDQVIDYMRLVGKSQGTVNSCHSPKKNGGESVFEGDSGHHHHVNVELLNK